MDDGPIHTIESRGGQVPDPAQQHIYAVRLRPYRSLSQRNFRVLLCIFSAISFMTTIPFVILGAWPVAGFMGIDVAIFYFAFRANFRAARAYEDVDVTPIALSLAKVSAEGARAEWQFNPSWVYLHKETHEEYGVQKVALVSRGRRVEVGSFLGPDDKALFAQDLSRALAEARRGPRYSD
ncbi:MAG: DUF2244 domain-containing protein [Methylovirgula sp.]|nr:DUF2244 domain-containing protein [Methylovirgula sp.]